MKYKDLISFEAIESVLKLAEANNKTKAEEHVKTFVMSENLGSSSEVLFSLTFSSMSRTTTRGSSS